MGVREKRPAAWLGALIIAAGLAVAGLILQLASARAAGTGSTPVLGTSAVIAPMSGTTYVTPPGQAQSLLAAPEQVPVGSVIDTTNGAVQVTVAADRSGATRTGTFDGGQFALLQSNANGAPGEIQLTGGDFSDCSQVGADYHRRRRRVHAQVLAGGFATVGRFDGGIGHAAASWDTSDSCSDTQVDATSGIVDAAVVDFSTLQRLKVPHPQPPVGIPPVPRTTQPVVVGVLTAACTPAAPANGRYRACANLYDYPAIGYLGTQLAVRTSARSARLCVTPADARATCTPFLLVKQRAGVAAAIAQCGLNGTGTVQWFLGSKPAAAALAFSHGTGSPGAPGGPGCGLGVAADPLNVSKSTARMQVQEVSGRVFLQDPHRHRVRLRGTSRIGLGTTVDAGRGSILLDVVGSAADGHVAQVSGGRFTVRQSVLNQVYEQPRIDLVMLPATRRGCATGLPRTILGRLSVTTESGGIWTVGADAETGTSTSTGGGWAGAAGAWTMTDECDGTGTSISKGLSPGTVITGTPFAEDASSPTVPGTALQRGGLLPGDAVLSVCHPATGVPASCAEVVTDHAARVSTFGLGVAHAASRYSLCLAGLASCRMYSLTPNVVGFDVGWVQCTFGAPPAPRRARWSAGRQRLTLPFRTPGRPIHGAPTGCRDLRTGA